MSIKMKVQSLIAIQGKKSSFIEAVCALISKLFR